MPLSPLTPRDRVGRHGEALCAEIDGEVVALNPAKGVCYGLDAIASEVWALIERTAPIGQVCGALVARYAVDPATCEVQVIALMEDLRAEGLLALHDPESATA